MLGHYQDRQLVLEKHTRTHTHLKLTVGRSFKPDRTLINFIREYNDELKIVRRSLTHWLAFTCVTRASVD